MDLNKLMNSSSVSSLGFFVAIEITTDHKVPIHGFQSIHNSRALNTSIIHPNLGAYFSLV